MANVTLDEEFNSLGNPWQTTYPWSPNGFAVGDMGSWLANPALLPPDGNPISDNNGIVTLSDFARPADVSANQTGGLSRIAGQILTEGNFSQTYGYFEARIQMPAGAGEMGAFWLLPGNGSRPPELDVAEMVGSAPNTVVNTLWGAGAPGGSWSDVADMTQGFHTYAVDWEPDKITWYFDNKETFETPTTPDMNQPMYMILSTTSGQPGSWEGTADPSQTSQMKIDYVRVYDANPYTTGGALTASTTPTDAASTPPSPPPVPIDTGVPTVQPSAPADATNTPASPATTAPAGQTTTSNNATVVNIGTDTLFATSSPDVFVFNGSGHHTSIRNFTPGSDKLDFEMTSQDFSNVAITAGRHGTQIDFDGNHVSLPGVTPDQLSQSNFAFDVGNNTAAA
jgi:beta-glucanase (GH16 family)